MTHRMQFMNTTISILKGLRSIPMTQTQISRLTGIPQARISRWEAGQVPVGADDVLKLQSLLQSQLSNPEPPPVAQAATEPVAQGS